MLYVCILFSRVVKFRAWDRSSLLRVVGTSGWRWRVGTVKRVETPVGTLATGWRRACGIDALFASPGGAHVAACRSSDAQNMAAMLRRLRWSSSRRLRNGRTSGNTSSEDLHLYRTLSDIPCRPGFVCTTSVRYNRSSVLQVYSRCAFDRRPTTASNWHSPLHRRRSADGRSVFAQRRSRIDFTSMSIIWIRYQPLASRKRS